MRNRHLPLLVLVLLIAAALACNAPSDGADSAAAPVPTSPPIAGEDPAPVLPTEQPPPAPEQPADEQPPAEAPDASAPAPVPDIPGWLVMVDGDAPNGRLSFIEGDGAGTPYTFPETYGAAPGQLRHNIAPSGGYIAYITGDIMAADLRLVVASLAEADLRPAPVSLTSGLEISAPDPGPGDPAFEAMRAFTDLTGLAWSPDGRALAYMAASDGPTSDLYVYFLGDATTVRLTDGPSQGIKPNWSPDGRYVLHAGVSTLGTGAGYGMEGVWAAAVDGSGVKDLYDPSGTADQVFFGWRNATDVVVGSADVMCGNRDLRVVNVETGTESMLWPHYFQSAAVADNGAVLISVDQTSAGCNADQPLAGTLLVDATSATPRQLRPDVSGYPTYVAGNRLFYLEGRDAVAAFTALGDFVEVNAPVQRVPSVSPDGRYEAWASQVQVEGVFVREAGQAARQVFPTGARSAVWSTNGQALFFAAPDGVYRAVAPDFVPERITSQVVPTAMWYANP